MSYGSFHNVEIRGGALCGWRYNHNGQLYHLRFQIRPMGRLETLDGIMPLEDFIGLNHEGCWYYPLIRFRYKKNCMGQNISLIR